MSKCQDDSDDEVRATIPCCFLEKTRKNRVPKKKSRILHLESVISSKSQLLTFGVTKQTVHS